MDNYSHLVYAHLGNLSILEQPKTAFLCSRQVPADAVLKCFDWAIQMREADRCVISGFHSALVTPFGEHIKRASTDTAAVRNELMIELADEVVIGYSNPMGTLSKQLDLRREKNLIFLT